MDATKLNPNMFSPWRAYPPPQPQTNYDAMISRALDGKIRKLSPRGLADILWGCAVTSRGTSKLFEELCDQAQKIIDVFSPRDIANFSWGLVKVKFQCWPLQTRFVKMCMSRLGEFDGESLVLTFWSLVQITELQDKLYEPVRAARYTLCQHIPHLSAPSCKRLWEILAILKQYDFDLCKMLDEQTGQWGYLMTPNELGEVLRAGGDLKYRMACLPTLLFLCFKHIEVATWDADNEDVNDGGDLNTNANEGTKEPTSKVATTMSPKMLSMFVLDLLRCIYCFGSWIERRDQQIRNDQIKKNRNNDDDMDQMFNYSMEQQQHNDSEKKTITAEEKEGEIDDGSRKSILPPLSPTTPILNDIALDILSSIMPTVLNNTSISQTMEMLMALTTARAYRTDGNNDSKMEPSIDRVTMYRAAWNKLGNGKSLNDGQIIQLCAIYDVSTFVSFLLHIESSIQLYLLLILKYVRFVLGYGI